MASNHSVKPSRSPSDYLSLLRDVRLAWKLFWDGRVPLWAKSIPLLSLAYVIWPFDFLADPVLGLGQLDDLAVIWLGIKLFCALGARLLAEERGPGADQAGGDADEIVDATYRVVSDDESS
ncbi:MAG: DUF1232 domain-containing protein [Chloroflexi bacterium]|nr:DUF1232 domain-containing protein [Chloroflexota bacterium]